MREFWIASNRKSRIGVQKKIYQSRHPIEPIFRLEDYGAEAVKKQLAMRRLLQTKTLYKPKPFDPEILGRNIFAFDNRTTLEGIKLDFVSN
ncbi:unnamed protein product [Acanthoscelides obtectus]|uniref:Uncharacterized protein n=1 Tax=Acanthoscelides obtectus TaxID=200917 RepID=A0A9P0MAD0_ACAOB|nr:unnamed protein product [Acanthoscelides obtectus]CAK1659866.1 hypothetical protein AOBTE_LOCUS21719 [Acanthoscelides obtectus]